MKRPKITIVGAGNVGATAAHICASKQLGDVVLIDIAEGVPQGKALDIFESSPVDRFDCRLVGSQSYDEAKGSDVVVVTAGIPRKPGMSRDDLIATNAKIMQSVMTEVKAKCPDSFLIIVSNPLDAMVYLAHKQSGFPKNRVMGMAGVLDTARYRSFIAAELDVSVLDVQAFVLGGHGDQMVPLPRYTTVGGIPLPSLLSAEKIEAIVDRTRKGGAEITKLLGTSAYYAPAASICEMVEAIVRDRKRILPAAALCEGEYGIEGIFVGVPVKLGGNGVEKVMEIELNDDEKAAFATSVDHVKSLCDGLG
ncbi:Malate dehydrogenase [Planctomycetes bacterium Pan216]|uniref:Malate dehydrogenase n=1 Tax=Kolteria novifilia TaxID=2527975 RepID=A0A518BD11_9BACT|nr:Malate dehydrogenase [Planctomycetes bacterium Pan216]